MVRTLLVRILNWKLHTSGPRAHGRCEEGPDVKTACGIAPVPDNLFSLLGVDVTSGQLPSKMEMFRLLMKTEVRESAMKMANGLHEAGIDLKSKVSLFLRSSLFDGNGRDPCLLQIRL